MRIIPLALAVVLAGGLASCSGSDDSTAAPTPTASPSATWTGTPGSTIHDLRALPRNRWSSDTLTIAVGDSIRVTDNDPDAPHNFVVPGVGESETLEEGDVFTLRFPKAGTFAFVCTFHESTMTGSVLVR